MGYGHGWGANLGIAVQADALTYTAPTMRLPIESESIRGKRSYKPTGAMYGTRTVRRQLPGVREAQGAINMELQPNYTGQMLRWWNGQESVSAVAAPTSLTATPSSGGSLVAGSHSYKVAPIYSKTGSTQEYLGPASGAASGTATESNATNGLAWSAAAAPTGFTLADHAVYVRRPGATKWTYLDRVGGTTTSYTDTGAKTPNGVSEPLPALYRHVFQVAAAVPLTNPLPYLSVLKTLDNDKAEWFAGLMLDKFSLNLSSNMGDPVKVTFDGLALNFGTAANDIASPTMEDSAMNWQGHLSVEGVTTNLLEGLQLLAANGLAYVDGLRGTDFHRAIAPNAVRSISGTLQFGHESQDQFERLCQEAIFALEFVIDGSWSHNVQDLETGINIAPLPCMIVTLPNCSYTEAGGNINGPQRMVESLPFVTADSGDGIDMQIDMFTSSATYSGAADVTAPTVSSTSPSDAATGVAIDANVVWTMSESLLASSVNAGSVILMTATGTNVPGTVTLSNAGASTTVTFNPTSNLSNSTDYVAVMTGVKDVAGNLLAAPSVVNFTTVGA